MNHISKAYQEALKSDLSHRVGAILIKSNRVLASGYNQMRHQSMLNTEHWPGSLHAEINVILDALRKTSTDKIKGSTLVVVRVRSNGKFGLAFPCENCYDIIQKFKIKKVIFSTNTSKFSEVKV